MIRLDLCHGASVDRLAAYISELSLGAFPSFGFLSFAFPVSREEAGFT